MTPTEKDRERAVVLTCYHEDDARVQQADIAAALASAREEGRREERLAIYKQAVSSSGRISQKAIRARGPMGEGE